MTLEKFHYTFNDKKKVAVKKVSQSPFGVLRKISQAGDDNEKSMEAVFYAIEKIADAKTMAVFDDQSIDDVMEFFKAWISDEAPSGDEDEPADEEANISPKS